MKVIYIAAPFRAPTAGQIEQNIRLAEAAALEVWKLGAVPICVHAMCRHYGGELSDEVWLAGDLELLHRCDALLIEGNISQGVWAEIKVAKRTGRMPIFYSLIDLKQWLKNGYVDEDFDSAPALITAAIKSMPKIVNPMLPRQKKGKPCKSRR